MIRKFLLTLVIFLAIDFLWLGLIAKGFYNKELGSFPRTFNWWAAVLAYVLLSLGIVFFVLPKTISSPFKSFIWGSVFGLVVYGIYDLTNLATLAGWSLKMTLVDAFWGMFVSSITSFIVSLILK